MSFTAQTSPNTTPLNVAINQIINLVYSHAHTAVVSRLLVEALHRPHRECEEMMHALHDYLLGFHLGGGKVHETYKNMRIFHPFEIELDPMDISTMCLGEMKSTCKCGGIHCTEWQYTYLYDDITPSGSHDDVHSILYLDMGSFYRSSYIQRGAAHARINWDFLDDIRDDIDEPTSPTYSSIASESAPQSPLQSCRTSRAPSPGPVKDDGEWHGFNCWCNECTYSDSGDEDYMYSEIDLEEYNPDLSKDDPDFSKDDRGGLNYYHKRHDKREYLAKKEAKVRASSDRRKQFKKRGARNPRPNERRATRNSKKAANGAIKRKRSEISSDEELWMSMSEDEEEVITPTPTLMYDNPHEDLQEQDEMLFDGDLQEKDSRYHRKKHRYMREKHIRDQEKMARELGIPVARKMKRRDIPSSRYNRHKDAIDFQNY